MLFSAAFIQPPQPPLNAPAAQVLVRPRPEATPSADPVRLTLSTTPRAMPSEEVPMDLDQRVRLSGEW